MQDTVKPRKWKSLRARLLTALIVVAICIPPFFIGGFVWALLVALFSTRMMYEWVRMTDPDAPRAAYAIAFVGLLVAVTYSVQGLMMEAFGTLLMATAVAVLERLRRGGIIWTAIGLPYIIIPAVVMILLRGDEIGFNTTGFTQVIFIIFIVIAADVGAYFGGSTIGGPKLAPRLSPNKTWAGAVSGLLFAVLIAVLCGFFIQLSPLYAATLAIPLVVLSVLGDLFESMAKRRIGVKDTGMLLPGHGGLLDRLDSLMAAIVGGAILFMFIGDGWPI
jgi:phosphatidate cytidylyltransferase